MVTEKALEGVGSIGQWCWLSHLLLQARGSSVPALHLASPGHREDYVAMDVSIYKLGRGTEISGIISAVTQASKQEFNEISKHSPSCSFKHLFSSQARDAQSWLLKYVQFLPTGWMPTSSVFAGMRYHRCDRPFYCHPPQDSLAEINSRAWPDPVPQAFKRILFTNKWLLNVHNCFYAKMVLVKQAVEDLSRKSIEVMLVEAKSNMEKGRCYEWKRQNPICVFKMLRTMFKHTHTHMKKKNRRKYTKTLTMTVLR